VVPASQHLFTWMTCDAVLSEAFFLLGGRGQSGLATSAVSPHPEIGDHGFIGAEDRLLEGSPDHFSRSSARRSPHRMNLITPEIDNQVDTPDRREVFAATLMVRSCARASPSRPRSPITCAFLGGRDGGFADANSKRYSRWRYE